jgi:alcohol dehydrogenase class IV
MPVEFDGERREARSMTMTLPPGVASFRTPHRILFGRGARSGIGDAALELGARRPLIVTDGFHAGNGVAAEIADLLAAAGAEVAIWAETVPDPTMSSVASAVRAALEHRADSVVGLGGGSPLDTAKAVALLAVRGGEMRDFKAPAVTTGHALPIVAVPTTAGSGSEATQFTIITDDATAEKMLCTGPVFLPTVAVVDPELTASMPARLTADTGIDALTHAVEAYVSRKAGALSDVFARRAMTLVWDNLLVAYRDGADAEARENMMLGSLLAGIAFSNSSVALVHGMSRPLGVRFGIPHGLSNAVLFAEVTRFSLPGAPERYADCARALRLAPDGGDALSAGAALADALDGLVAELAVPGLAELGVAADDWAAAIPTMAAQALASGSPANNPVVPSSDEIAALYGKVYTRR